MGNTCKPMAVSFQCMTKFTTNKKKKKMGKKKKKGISFGGLCMKKCCPLKLRNLSPLFSKMSLKRTILFKPSVPRVATEDSKHHEVTLFRTIGIKIRSYKSSAERRSIFWRRGRGLRLQWSFESRQQWIQVMHVYLCVRPPTPTPTWGLAAFDHRWNTKKNILLW